MTLNWRISNIHMRHDLLWNRIDWWSAALLNLLCEQENEEVIMVKFSKHGKLE